MTPSRFARLLDRHGARIDRWPAVEREAARRRLGNSGRCRRAYLAALDADPKDAEPVDPEVLTRMAEQVRRRVAQEPVLARRSRVYPSAVRAAPWAALAACAALGAWLGQAERVPAAQATLLASVQITALDSSSADLLR